MWTSFGVLDNTSKLVGKPESDVLRKWVKSEKMRHKMKIFTKFQTSLFNLFNFWGISFDCIYIEVCKSKLAIKKTKN
jgi:hypothetical protein